MAFLFGKNKPQHPSRCRFFLFLQTTKQPAKLFHPTTTKPNTAYIHTYTVRICDLYAGTIYLIFWLIRGDIAKIAIFACFSHKMTLYIALYGLFL